MEEKTPMMGAFLDSRPDDEFQDEVRCYIPQQTTSPRLTLSKPRGNLRLFWD